MVLATAADCEINASLPFWIGTGEAGVDALPRRQQPQAVGAQQPMAWRCAQAFSSANCSGGEESTMAVCSRVGPAVDQRQITLGVGADDRQIRRHGRLATSG